MQKLPDAPDRKMGDARKEKEPFSFTSDQQSDNT